MVLFLPLWLSRLLSPFSSPPLSVLFSPTEISPLFLPFPFHLLWILRPTTRIILLLLRRRKGKQCWKPRTKKTVLLRGKNFVFRLCANANDKDGLCSQSQAFLPFLQPRATRTAATIINQKTTKKKNKIIN